ncbi:MAG: FlgD immunoglobulin-like domain containing protein [Candidatus Latescibacteria bacterium]|nr:FlgD immunoglobulin-like domain containing protein [Candidatus Latescibacterota bacterium]
MSAMSKFHAVIVLTSMLVFGAAALAATHDYIIVDLGVVAPGDQWVQGNAASPRGMATGRSVGGGNQAFLWSYAGGLVGLPNLAGRPYSVGNGVNDAGVVVGNGTTTSWGAGPLPLIWQGGTVAQLPLPAGETLGRAEAINNAGLVAGSVDGGSMQVAAIFTTGGATIVTATTPEGCYSNTLYGINDAGLAVGTGIDPGNLARNVGFLYDTGTGVANEVGALDGCNGALCFGVSEAGHVVGSSMLNQGAGSPFVWTAADGIQPVPLPAGTSQGGARDANSDGWVVGTASSAYAIPYLYDGETTHRLADLLPDGTGWDLEFNTSSSAEGISDEGIIVGTGEHDGNVRGYAMIPNHGVPVLLQDFAAVGRDDGIEVSWELWLDGADLDVTLQRATDAAGPWAAVSAAPVAGDRGALVLDADTQIDLTYHYRLVLDEGGEAAVLGTVSARRTQIGVADVVLGGASPNPTRGATALAYRLPAPQEVRLTVHDVRGRLVRTLVDGAVSGGDHLAQWDGHGDGGAPAPVGVYFFKLQTSQAARTQKVVLTR